MAEAEAATTGTEATTETEEAATTAMAVMTAGTEIATPTAAAPAPPAAVTETGRATATPTAIGAMTIVTAADARPLAAPAPAHQLPHPLRTAAATA